MKERLPLDTIRDNWLSTLFDLSANYRIKLTIEGEWAATDDKGRSSGDGFDAMLEIPECNQEIASVIGAEDFEEAMQEIARQAQPWLSQKTAENKEATDLWLKSERRERAEKKKSAKSPKRAAKCSVCNCPREAGTAWQPFGPDGRLTMTRLGSHYRGFPVIKLCDEHEAQVKNLWPVEVKYRGKVIRIDPIEETQLT